MFDPTAPSSLLALEQYRQERVRKKLFDLAFLRTGSEDDAEDLLSDALCRVLDPEDAPWDPARAIFVTHVSFVMRQTLDRQRRRASARLEVADVEAMEVMESAPASGRADEEIDRRRSVAVRRSLLEEVLDAIGDKHPHVRAICELAACGVEEAGEQARALGLAPDEVYRAHETLRYHARRAMRERELAEERRMRDLQQASGMAKEGASR